MAKAVTMQTVGKPIGTVKALVGSATATDASGVKRVLHVGDKIYPNETVQADAAGGTVHIEFVNSGFATLASGQTLALDHTFFQGGDKPMSAEEIQTLQAKIAAGMDPTEFMEASAAGPSAAGGGGEEGSHQFVIVQQNAARGDVTPGFDTGTFGNPYEQIASNAGVLVETAAGDNSNNGGNEQNQPGEPVIPGESIIYDARAVIYTKEGGDSLTFSGVNVVGNPQIDPKYAAYFDISIDSNTGEYVLTLTDAGKAALSNIPGNGNLYTYLTLTTDQGDLVVQMIVNKSDSLNSQNEDAKTDGDGRLNPDTGLIHGEWHQGLGFNADTNRIDSSGLGDTVVFAGGIAADGNTHSNIINTHTNEDREATITIGTDGVLPNIAMNATDGGSNTIIGADGKVESGVTDVFVNASGTGMNASDGGSNTISYVNDVKITTDNGNGDAYGMKASGADSANKILNAATVGINANAVSAQYATAAGMYAENGAKNIIEANDGVKITAADQGSGNAGGMMAVSGNGDSVNSITTDGDVTITLSGLGANGMITSTYGNGASTANTIEAKGKVDITVDASSSDGSRAWSNGVRAYGDGGNTINADEVSISLTSTGGASNNGHDGMSAYEGGNNTISANDVEIAITTEKGIVKGLYAETGSNNTIAGGSGDVTITTASGSGAAYGLYAKSGGTNTISDVGGAVTVNTGTAGLHATGAGSQNTINNVDTVNVNAQNAGLKVESGGVNSITDAGTVNVTASSAANAVYGMQAAGAGHNEIDANGNVIVNANASAIAEGLSASKGYNTIEAVGDVKVSVNVDTKGNSADNVSGIGVFTADGRNEITGKNVFIGLNVTDTDGFKNNVTAYGMQAGGVNFDNNWNLLPSGGKNSIVADGAVTINASTNATGSYAEAAGLIAYSFGANEITAGGDVTIDVSSSRGANGMLTYGGTNTITAAGQTVTINASVDQLGPDNHAYVNGVRACGLDSNVESGNTITAGTVNIAVSSARDVDGVSAYEGGFNTITADTVTIAAEGIRRTGGLYAETKGTNEILGAKDVTIRANMNELGEIIGSGNAWGLRALSSGSNTVEASGQVDIKAGSSTGNAIGMSAEGGMNTVNGGTLNITAASTSTSNGIGLKAESGGINTIKTYNTTPNTTTTSVKISVNGTGGNVYGMYAHGGTNTVESGNSAGQKSVDLTAVNIAAKSNTGDAYGLLADMAGSANSITIANSGRNQGVVDYTNISATSKSGNAYGLYAKEMGTNTIQGSYNVTISATGGSSAEGVYAKGATNTVNVQNYIGVTSNALGTAYGVRALEGGKNEFNAYAMSITAKSTAGDAYGISAIGSGTSNTIKATGDVKSTVTATEIARSVQADANAVNKISGSITTFEATGKQAYALSAENGGSNTVTASREVRISATSTGGVAEALHARLGGENKITGNMVTVTTTNTSNTRAEGLYASSGGSNMIDTSKAPVGVNAPAGSGDVRITVNWDAANNKVLGTGQAFGASATWAGASNIIKAAGTVDVAVGSGNGLVRGLDAAQGGKNSIEAAAVNIHTHSTVTSSSSLTNYAVSANPSSAEGIASNTIKAAGLVNIVADSTGVADTSALYAFTGGKNVIEAGAVKLAAASGSGIVSAMFASGEYAAGSERSHNSITSSGSVEVTANSVSGNSYGVRAGTGGINTIDAGTVSIDAKTQSGSAYGLFVTGSSTNTVTASDRVDIKAVSIGNSSSVFGLYANGGGQNAVNGTSKIAVNANGTYSAYGLHSDGSGSKNTLTMANGGTVDINTVSTGSSAYGLSANNGGQNTISNASTLNINATGVAYALGLSANGVGSKNTLAMANGGTVDITTASTSVNTYGMKADNGAQNEISNAGKVDITATSGVSVRALYAELGFAKNIITMADGGTVNINATSTTNSTALGMWAISSGQNTINNAKEITINAIGGDGAYGMRAQGTDSKNTLAMASGGTVDITSNSKSSNAYGMCADGGQNEISNASKVTIDTKGSGDAYGMHALSGGTNTIQAGAGSSGITVTIKVAAGDSAKAIAMLANNGKNQIIGSDARDIINITGKIEAVNGGKNLISTGAGDDLIILNGQVVGSLVVDGGAGYDTLTLTAANWAEFAAYYQAWLTTVDSVVNIESIRISLAEGHDTVPSWFADLNTAHPEWNWVWDDTGLQTTSIALSSFMLEGADYQISDSDNHTNHDPLAGLRDTTHTGEIPVAEYEAPAPKTEQHHEIILPETDHTLEAITYDSLVNVDGSLNMDALHAIKDTLVGGGDHDLYGSTGNDILFGGAGHDTLHGGAGDDIIISGTGQTTVIYQQGDLEGVTHGDIILDFKLGQDMLDISDLLTGAPSGSSVTDLFNRGYLNFEQITQNEDGSSTIKLSIDTDGSAGNTAAAVPLAEITLNGLSLGGDTSNHAVEILSQIHNEVKF